jgi:hypothetical protein
MSLFSESFLLSFPPSTLRHHKEKTSVLFMKGQELTIHQKKTISDEIIFSDSTVSKISDYLSLSDRRIRKIVVKAKAGKMLYEKAGRPARVDPVGIATGFLTVINAKENNKPMKKSECKKMVVDLARQSDVRKGFSGLDFSISKTTVNSVYNATNITFEKGQVTTVPRDRETRDIRNFVGQAALNEALVKDLDPHMIANWDATSFGVNDDNIELLATVKEEGDKPLTLVENSKFEMGVKWFALMNANGNLGKDVFVISDPSLPSEEFIVDEIKCLYCR